MSQIREAPSVLCGCKALSGQSGEWYVETPGYGFKDLICRLSGVGYNLIGLFCAENFQKTTGFTLFYLFEKPKEPGIIAVSRLVDGSRTTSIEDTFPAACWYEREIKDGFGISFDGAFDERRLFLHEPYPESFHPLLKSFKNGPIKTRQDVPCADEYQFKHVHGEEVYQIPVGPVHAGIIEPGHFRFSVIGENIYNLEVRMFYKHRGLEKLAEGRTPQDCMPLVESISGDETVANSVGFANAIETISKIDVPARAWYIRTLLLELERVYSHLGDMAGMVVDVAYAAGASPFFILREEILRHNEALTGSRFMKGMIAVGGLKRDVRHSALSGLEHSLPLFLGKFNEAVGGVLSSPSVIDRFERTGIIRPELIAPLNLTGPTARASGLAIDGRIDHPYGIYQKLELSACCSSGCDVMARFDVRIKEIRDSVGMMRKLLLDMPSSGVTASATVRDGFALSLVEAPRGQSLHWVNLKAGKIDRYKVRTPSFCNWQAIEHAVLGNIVPDFPLINKSLNLSYAGTDL